MLLFTRNNKKRIVKLLSEITSVEIYCNVSTQSHDIYSKNYNTLQENNIVFPILFH
jgi:hypothetical protein